ncbi:MAG: ATP synthase F0 subunit B [Nitrospirae bacterium RBG_13_41_22]|nr:MAG: ATP synthase F0 subunit B [Nitrospirae bacterium RBG_13_41_22]
MRNKKQKTKNRIQKFKKLILPLFIFSIAFASYAFGSSEEAEHATPLWKEYMWKIINFGILILILFKFAKKPLQNFLQKRTELIEKTLNEAKEAKEAATKALKEVEERLKVKDSEIEAIMSAAKKSGEHERDSIIEESTRLKEKILEQAKTNIDFELKHAKEVLKAEAVELAMELAEKKLKDKLTKDEQEKLLEDSLMKIGGKG